MNSMYKKLKTVKNQKIEKKDTTEKINKTKHCSFERQKKKKPFGKIDQE